MTIPYTFAGATTAIPLSKLDANFASPITLGNVAMTLSNTYTSIGNLTLTNVTINSGFLSTATIPTANGTVMVSGNMPAFSATQSVSQNISTTTATKLTFTSSDFDTTGGMFASSRFTPTVAGYYQISSAVQTTTVGSTASYSNYFYIYKNGSTIKQSANISLINLTQSGFISALVYCNGSTDYIEIYFYQGSGTTVATFADTTRTYFQATLVRSA